MKRIKLSVAMTVQNTALRTVTNHRVDGEYVVDHIVGFVRLKAEAGKPLTQILTTVGPIDVFESYETVSKLLDEAA
jgi:hypothetical protein